MHRHQRSPNDSSFLKKEINHPIYLNTYANLYFFHQCIFLKKPLKGKVNLICLHYLLLLEKKGYHCRSTTTKLEKANGQELLSLLTKILFIIKILIYYNQFEFYLQFVTVIRQAICIFLRTLQIARDVCGALRRKRLTTSYSPLAEKAVAFYLACLLTFQ